MGKPSRFIRKIYIALFLGLLFWGCGKENINSLSQPKILPLSILPDNKEFVRTQNSWISDTGFSQISMVESYQKWESLKNSQGKTYEFQRSFSSLMSRYYSTYQFLVIEDSIARIIRNNFQINSQTGKTDSLGSFDVPTDSAVYHGILNVDNIYKYALDSVLTKNKSENTIYTELFNNGLLKSCKYRPNNCVDDCLFGVSIDYLFFGEIRPKN
jgi:hypothetical protein